MAKAFLRQLPQIPSYALPSDAICPICVQPYDDQTNDRGSFEKAVCLPCNGNHIFGSECLAKWLRHGTSCPLCRHELGLPKAVSVVIILEETTPEELSVLLDVQRNQAWEEYWYVTF